MISPKREGPPSSDSSSLNKGPICRDRPYTLLFGHLFEALFGLLCQNYCMHLHIIRNLVIIQHN